MRERGGRGRQREKETDGDQGGERERGEGRGERAVKEGRERAPGFEAKFFTQSRAAWLPPSLYSGRCVPLYTYVNMCKLYIHTGIYTWIYIYIGIHIDVCMF